MNSDYTFLENGRNQAQVDGEVKLTFKVEQLSPFEEEFNQFMSETKTEDELTEPVDEEFKDANYPSWSHVLLNQNIEILKLVLNEYLFVEFFSKFLNNKSKNLIIEILDIEISSDQINLNCSYTALK